MVNLMAIKKTCFALITAIFLILNVSGQQGAELAFSKSYSFEYDSEYGKAISSLLDLKADNYQVNLRLGWLYYLNKDYPKSEVHYKKAIQMEPSSIEARFGLALPLSALGNYNHVLEVYLEILKIDPNNSIANYRAASIYLNRRDYSNASSFISKVIKMYPFDYDSNLLNGKILSAQNKNSEAKRYFEKALQYNPQSEDAKTALKNLK
jgi:tetratricopeptide (TPR) repeat protein